MVREPTILKTLRGSDGRSVPALAFNTSAAQALAVAADTELRVPLDPGIYYVISQDSDFEFTHGSGDISGFVRIPWFKNVYLELVITDHVDLAISFPPGVSGGVILIPAEEHS